MAQAFIFPGQGSQDIGMGKSLYEASPHCKAVFEEVDDAIDFTLSRLIFDGEIEELTLTKNVQPALMAVSMAAIVYMLHLSGSDSLADVAQAVAGHSLGEYSALTAAGALTIRQSAQLLRARGQAMQKAVPFGEGAMLAVIGLDIGQVSEISEKIMQESRGVVCEIANDNAPGQIVLSGSAAMRDPVTRIAKSMGARRVLPLTVSAPFHCSLMGYARDVMRERLQDATIQTPQVPVYANVDTKPTTDLEKIRKNLIDQVCGRVRWRETIQRMSSEGYATYAEIGAGKVLAGLIKRLDKNAETLNIQEAEDVRAFCQGQSLYL